MTRNNTTNSFSGIPNHDSNSLTFRLNAKEKLEIINDHELISLNKRKTRIEVNIIINYHTIS